MTTYLGKSCSFGLPRVLFVNCRQFMYLVISLLVLRAGCGISLYQFLIIAYLFTLIRLGGCPGWFESLMGSQVKVFVLSCAGSLISKRDLCKQSRNKPDKWATAWENLFMPYANNKGADQPAHPRSLISAFTVRCLDSIIYSKFQASTYLLWLRMPIVSYLVANPEDRFSRDDAQMETSNWQDWKTQPGVNKLRPTLRFVNTNGCLQMQYRSLFFPNLQA